MRLMGFTVKIKEFLKNKKKKPVQYCYIEGKGKEYFLLAGARRPLKITRLEAYRILELMNEGYSSSVIFEEMDFKHNVTVSTVRRFIRNYEDGMFKGVL